MHQLLSLKNPNGRGNLNVNRLKIVSRCLVMLCNTVVSRNVVVIPSAVRARRFILLRFGFLLFLIIQRCASFMFLGFHSFKLFGFLGGLPEFDCGFRPHRNKNITLPREASIYILIITWNIIAKYCKAKSVSSEMLWIDLNRKVLKDPANTLTSFTARLLLLFD